MNIRWLLVGLAFSVIAAACAPGTGTTASSTSMGQTLDAASQPIRNPSAVASTTSATGLLDPLRNSVPAESDLPLGGPVPPGAPDVVAERAPLPYCGATSLFPTSGVNPFIEIEVSGDADDCFRSRAGLGLPTEMIEIRSTTEGDPVLMIRRLLPDGREEVFSDLTRDAFGAQAWFRHVCSGYEEENCEPSEELSSADLAPPGATLFEITPGSDETGPPFYVTADGVTAAEDDAWATHRVTIVSEWRTPVAVLPPPTRYVLDSSRVSRPPPSETGVGQPTVIQPGASMSVLLALRPRLSTGPAPGIYEIVVPITYWRDVDAAAGPTGSPENTLILHITYQILDVRTASAIDAFCDRALVVPATDLAEFDQERLDRGLEAMEVAAEQLPPPRREELLAETAQLRLKLEQWFSPTPGHGGFSTVGIIWFINRVCGTDLPAMSVQA